MNISDLHADLLDLPRDVDSTHFIATCRAAKTEIGRLLEDYCYEEAANLSGALNKLFAQTGWKGATVMVDILPIFPANHNSTLRHLGKDRDVDKIILASKLNIDELSSFDGEAWLHVLAWAREARDLAMIERVILRIVEDIHENGPNNSEHLRDVSLKMISKAAPDGADPLPLGDSIDTAISSIISYCAENNLNARKMPVICSHGLSKTFLKLLEKSVFSAYFPHLFSDQENQAVYGALPSDPTPLQTFWMQRCIAKPGVNERILFDSSFDIEEYIEVLRPPSTTRPSGLCFPVLKLFRSLLTPEHLNSLERKRRAGLLVNAVVDHQMKLNRRTPEEIRNFLVDGEFDPYVLKMTRVLKGTILEEELGL